MKTYTNVVDYYVRMCRTIIIVVTSMLLTNIASAQNLCFPVSGSFAAVIQLPLACTTSAVGFCTAGTLTGGLNGDYKFSANQMMPAQEYNVPSVYFYSGVSEVSTHRGALSLIDAGGIDLITGKVSGLLTVTGGTEYYANATGYLYIYGSSNASNQTTAGRYEGEVCIVR